MTNKTSKASQTALKKNPSALLKDPSPKTRSCEKLLEWIDENFEYVVYPEEFEDCIVGVAERYGGPPVAVLDVEKMLAALQKEGMTKDEAIDYFENNILVAYVGESTPVYMHIPNFKVEKNRRTKGKETA